jgi:hypothetical protein
MILNKTVRISELKAGDENEENKMYKMWQITS